MSSLTTLVLLAQMFCIQPAQSHFMIHVGSSGVFSVFGHDHLIEATEIKGCAMIDWDDMEKSSVNLTFASAGIKVLDPDHPKDRPDVQKEMETNVLSVSEFPTIQFRSTAVHAQSQALISVEGILTIHGQSRNVTIPLKVARTGQAVKVSGRHTVRQTAFGIKPTRVAGGLVRVQDDVRCDFDLVLE